MTSKMFLLAALALGFSFVQSGETSTGSKAPTGKALYKMKCASCHGQDGKGSPAMAKMFRVALAATDLSKPSTQAKKDEELVSLIAKGAGKMPAFATLNKDEMAGLVDFVRSLAAPAKKVEEEKPKEVKGAAPGKKP